MDNQSLLAELPRLRRYARALVGDRMAADDLVQDTLERAWTRVHQWHPGSDLRKWLFAIMHNLRIDQLRRPTLNLTPIEGDVQDLSVRPTQTDTLELNALALALQQLPEEQRSVLLLIALEDMSYAEISETLALPLGTVMSRLARGRERLRRILDGAAEATPLRVVR